MASLDFGLFFSIIKKRKLSIVFAIFSSSIEVFQSKVSAESITNKEKKIHFIEKIPNNVM
jgi:hypothetical protein